MNSCGSSERFRMSIVIWTSKQIDKNRYVGGGQQPMKVRFRSQMGAEVLGGSWKLLTKEYQNVWIRKEFNVEEGYIK